MHSCMCSYIHAIYNIRTHTHTHPYKQCIHRKHSETGILAIPDVHVYTHTCMRAYIHIHECVHTYIYMNACMLIYIHRKHSQNVTSVIYNIHTHIHTCNACTGNIRRLVLHLSLTVMYTHTCMRAYMHT
jgi:hypothetical protein